MTPALRFPRPLQSGDRIAVTAPSSGVEPRCHARLDLVLSHLRHLGFDVVEGDCLRDERHDASAPAAQRAEELMRFLIDPSVAAVMPPWGGELACDLLDRIDFDTLRGLPPKWLLGFSDLSTLQVPLALRAGWGTAHGPNLMDLAPSQTDPLTTGCLPLLRSFGDTPVVQQASRRWQRHFIDFGPQPDAALNLTERTRWRRLDGVAAPLTLRGRLIGGCLDTLAPMAGTRHADVPGFVRACGADGALLFLENCEQAPPALARALWGLRRNGWFDGLAGLLLGRSSGPDATAPHRLNHDDALRRVLADLPCPVLLDLDIGHRPPQFTLVQGAWAQVHFDAAGGGHLTQAARPF